MVSAVVRTAHGDEKEIFTACFTQTDSESTLRIRLVLRDQCEMFGWNWRGIDIMTNNGPSLCSLGSHT